MSDLISRDELLRDFENERKWFHEHGEIGLANGYVLAMQRVNSFPAVDAVEVVHARWAYTDEGYKVCSNCCWEHPVLDNNGFTVADTFCPSCGAKMDGGEDDDV